MKPSADPVRVLDVQHDAKIKAYSIMTSMTIGHYLQITSQGEASLEIQRDIVAGRKSRIYDRLVEDLKNGCIIPPIVLVLRNTPADLPPLLTAEELSAQNKTALETHLSYLDSAQVAILDGLQRTNSMQKARTALEGAGDDLKTFLDRRIRVEFWVEITFQAILYRMITLNAGQTPMSMRHQLEVLSLPILDAVKSARPDLDVWLSRENSRRRQALQYQFAHLIEGYTAFLTQSPFTDPKNQVVEELNRISFLNMFETSARTYGLADFIQTIADVDQAICHKYPQIPGGQEDETTLQYGHQVFGRPPFFTGFCSALGRAYLQLSSESFRGQVQALLALLQSQDDDPLELALFNSLVNKIPSNARVGNVQRELVNNAFDQYFTLNRPFRMAWQYAGARM